MANTSNNSNLIYINKIFSEVEFNAYKDIMDEILLMENVKYKQMTNIKNYRNIKKHPDEYKLLEKMKKRYKGDEYLDIKNSTGNELCYKPYTRKKEYKANTDGLYRPIIATGLGSVIDEMLCKHLIRDLNPNMTILKLEDIARDPHKVLNKVNESIEDYSVILTGDDLGILLTNDTSNTRFIEQEVLIELRELFKNGLFFTIAGFNPGIYYEELENIPTNVLHYKYEHFQLQYMSEITFIERLGVNIISLNITRQSLRYINYMFSTVCERLNVEYNKKALFSFIRKHSDKPHEYDLIKRDFIEYLLSTTDGDIQNNKLHNTEDISTVYKEYRNLDVIINKNINDLWLSKVLGCPLDMVQKWIRRGMLPVVHNRNLHYHTNSMYSSKNLDESTNPFHNIDKPVLKTLEWLRLNNKMKYANRLEEYLKSPYICEKCLYTLNKNKKEANNAMIYIEDNDNQFRGYICNECHSI